MKYRRFVHMLKKNARFQISYDNDFLENIPLQEERTVSPDNTFQIIRRLVVGFAMSAFAVLVGLGLYLDLAVSSVVTVDVNPSIEIGLNAFGRVRSVEGLNGDGEIIADDLTYDNGSLSLILTEIQNKCIDLGYLDSDTGAMLLGVSGRSEKAEEKVYSLIEDNEDGFSVDMLVLTSYVLDDELSSSGYQSISFNQSSTYSFWSIFSKDYASSDESTSSTIITTTSAYMTADGTSGETNDAINNRLSSNISNDELVNMAEEYGITETKMGLILIVYANYADYQSDTGLLELVSMDLSSLITLYNDISFGG